MAANLSRVKNGNNWFWIWCNADRTFAGTVSGTADLWIFRSSLMSTAKLNEYPPSFIPHEWLWANYSKALETFEYWRYSGILSPSSFRQLLLVR